jgi:hypothetical protein
LYRSEKFHRPITQRLQVAQGDDGTTMTRPTMILAKVMRSKCAILGVLVLAAHSWAQTAPKAIFVESFRKGPTRISEQSILANLNSQNPYYKAAIKDFDGTDRYQISLEPHREAGGAERIVSWQVQLIDPRRRYLGNYLVATKPPEPLSDRAQDRAWWLDPSPYAVVPLLARRVFKVEGFYCVIQVKDYHVLTPESRLLDSMRVELQFTGTDPRQN